MTVAEQLCDRVAFINEGKILALDSPKNLMIEHGKAFVDITYAEGNTIKEQTLPLEDAGQNALLTKLLNTKKVLTIHSQEATLEDVFIKFTGRSLI